ncbi:MAG: DUF4157 domain-containing protein [Chloroflexota bacterium]
MQDQPSVPPHNSTGSTPDTASQTNTSGITLSPWVQHYWENLSSEPAAPIGSQPQNETDDVTPITGHQDSQAGVAVSAMQYRVDKAEAMVPRGTVWHPDLGRLQPEMVAQFVEKISDDFAALSKKYEFEPLELRDATEQTYVSPFDAFPPNLEEASSQEASYTPPSLTDMPNLFQPTPPTPAAPVPPTLPSTPPSISTPPTQPTPPTKPSVVADPIIQKRPRRRASRVEERTSTSPKTSSSPRPSTTDSTEDDTVGSPHTMGATGPPGEVKATSPTNTTSAKQSDTPIQQVVSPEIEKSIDHNMITPQPNQSTSSRSEPKAPTQNTSIDHSPMPDHGSRSKSTTRASQLPLAQPPVNSNQRSETALETAQLKTNPNRFVTDQSDEHPSDKLPTTTEPVTNNKSSANTVPTSQRIEDTSLSSEKSARPTSGDLPNQTQKAVDTSTRSHQTASDTVIQPQASMEKDVTSETEKRDVPAETPSQNLTTPIKTSTVAPPVEPEEMVSQPKQPKKLPPTTERSLMDNALPLVQPTTSNRVPESGIKASLSPIESSTSPENHKNNTNNPTISTTKETSLDKAEVAPLNAKNTSSDYPKATPETIQDQEEETSLSTMPVQKKGATDKEIVVPVNAKTTSLEIQSDEVPNMSSDHRERASESPQTESIQRTKTDHSPQEAALDQKSEPSVKSLKNSSLSGDDAVSKPRPLTQHDLPLKKSPDTTSPGMNTASEAAAQPVIQTKPTLTKDTVSDKQSDTNTKRETNARGEKNTTKEPSPSSSPPLQNDDAITQQKQIAENTDKTVSPDLADEHMPTAKNSGMAKLATPPPQETLRENKNHSGDEATESVPPVSTREHRQTESIDTLSPVSHSAIATERDQAKPSITETHQNTSSGNVIQTTTGNPDQVPSHPAIQLTEEDLTLRQPISTPSMTDAGPLTSTDKTPSEDMGQGTSLPQNSRSHQQTDPVEKGNLSGTDNPVKPTQSEQIKQDQPKPTTLAKDQVQRKTTGDVSETSTREFTQNDRANQLTQPELILRQTPDRNDPIQTVNDPYPTPAAADIKTVSSDSKIKPPSPSSVAPSSSDAVQRRSEERPDVDTLSSKNIPAIDNADLIEAKPNLPDKAKPHRPSKPTVAITNEAIDDSNSSSPEFQPTKSVLANRSSGASNTDFLLVQKQQPSSPNSPKQSIHTSSKTSHSGNSPSLQKSSTPSLKSSSVRNNDTPEKTETIQQQKILDSDNPTESINNIDTSEAGKSVNHHQNTLSTVSAKEVKKDAIQDTSPTPFTDLTDADAKVDQVGRLDMPLVQPKSDPSTDVQADNEPARETMPETTATEIKSTIHAQHQTQILDLTKDGVTADAADSEEQSELSPHSSTKNDAVIETNHDPQPVQQKPLMNVELPLTHSQKPSKAEAAGTDKDAPVFQDKQSTSMKPSLPTMQNEPHQEAVLPDVETEADVPLKANLVQPHQPQPLTADRMPMLKPVSAEPSTPSERNASGQSPEKITQRSNKSGQSEQLSHSQNTETTSQTDAIEIHTNTTKSASKSTTSAKDTSKKSVISRKPATDLPMPLSQQKSANAIDDAPHTSGSRGTNSRIAPTHSDKLSVPPQHQSQPPSDQPEKPITQQKAKQTLRDEGWRFKENPGKTAATSEQINQATDQLLQRKGAGNPLPDEPREMMEEALGHDFSQVRIHTTQMKSLNAEAATKGNDVYLKPGQSQFNDAQSLALLGHELTHVVQQGGATPLSPVQRKAAPHIARQGSVQQDEASADRTERFILKQAKQAGQSKRQPKQRKVFSANSSLLSRRPVQSLLQRKRIRPEKTANVESGDLISADQLAQQILSGTEPTPTVQRRIVQRTEPVSASATASTPNHAPTISEEEIDLKALAQKLYPIIKRRLTVEAERRPYRL